MEKIRFLVVLVVALATCAGGQKGPDPAPSTPAAPPLAIRISPPPDPAGTEMRVAVEPLAGGYEVRISYPSTAPRGDGATEERP